MRTNQAFEGGDLESSGVSEVLWNSVVGHLTPEHTAYYSKWQKLIDLENMEADRYDKLMFKHSSEKKEAKTGRCISNLQVGGMNTAAPNC